MGRIYDESAEAPDLERPAAPPAGEPLGSYACAAGNATVARVLTSAPTPALRPLVSRLPSPSLARDREAPEGGVGAAGPQIEADVATQAQKLMAGAYDDAGKYKGDGSGFDGEPDALLKKVGSEWGGGIDTTAPPTGQSSSSGPGGGDSQGASVAAHPPWVAAFQSKLIAVNKWTADDKIAQRLLQVFARSWTKNVNQGNLPPNVASFYNAMGANENNRAATDMNVGWSETANSADWCAQASSAMVVSGLLRNGLRFKMSAPKEKFGASRQNAIGLQQGKYVDWVKRTHKTTGAWGDTAHMAELQAGDVISYWSKNHGPQATGHVVTCVTGLQAGQEGALTVVSGNAKGAAAGQGAVRLEQVTRKDAPAGVAGGSTKRPSEDGVVWVWSITRASQLNAVAALAAGGETAALQSKMDEFGLETCTPLDEMWPPGESTPGAKAGPGEGAMTPGNGGTTPDTPAPGGSGTTPGGGHTPDTPDPSGGGGTVDPGEDPPVPQTPAEAPPKTPAPAGGGGGTTPGEAPGGTGGGLLEALGQLFQSIASIAAPAFAPLTGGLFGSLFGSEEADAEQSQSQGQQAGSAGGAAGSSAGGTAGAGAAGASGAAADGDSGGGFLESLFS